MKKILSLMLCAMLAMPMMACKAKDNGDVSSLEQSSSSYSGTSTETADGSSDGSEEKESGGNEEVDDGGNQGGEDKTETTLFTSYDAVIAKLKYLTLYKYTNEELPPRGSVQDVGLDALYEVLGAYNPSIQLGYAFKDVNGDGEKELLILEKGCAVHAIFTLVNGVPLPVETFVGGRGGITADGFVCYSELVTDVRSAKHIKKLVGKELVGIEYGYWYGENSDIENVRYYKVVEGVTSDITEAEKKLLDQQYASRMESLTLNTRLTGVRYYDALIDESTEDLPKADFSTYDGVIAAYTAMFEGANSKYAKYKWTRGDYNALLQIDSDADYEIYQRILAASVLFAPKSGAQDYGYALKDLSDDGVKELVLLNSGFDVLAIFTQTDGKAVLLDSFLPARSAFIDADGRIHVKKEMGGVSGLDCEYTLYEVKDGGLQTKFVIGCTYNVDNEVESLYQIENGARETLTQTAWDALYASYAAGSDGVAYNTYTQSHAGLTYLSIVK